MKPYVIILWDLVAAGFVKVCDLMWPRDQMVMQLIVYQILGKWVNGRCWTIYAWWGVRVGHFWMGGGPGGNGQENNLDGWGWVRVSEGGCRLIMPNNMIFEHVAKIFNLSFVTTLISLLELPHTFKDGRYSSFIRKSKSNYINKN